MSNMKNYLILVNTFNEVDKELILTQSQRSDIMNILTIAAERDNLSDAIAVIEDIHDKLDNAIDAIANTGSYNHCESELVTEVTALIVICYKLRWEVN